MGPPLRQRRLPNHHRGTVDPVSAEVLLVGSSTSSFDLSGLPVVAKGLTTALVAKLNAPGVPLWVNAWGGHEAFATTVALGPNGDVLVGGSFSGKLDVGESLSASPLERRVWLARLNSQGTVQWAKQGTGSAFTACTSWPSTRQPRSLSAVRPPGHTYHERVGR